jgi:hypothetical protein
MYATRSAHVSYVATVRSCAIAPKNRSTFSRGISHRAKESPIAARTGSSVGPPSSTSATRSRKAASAAVVCGTRSLIVADGASTMSSASRHNEYTA